METICFPFNNLCENDMILLKFILYLTINKIQVDLEQGAYASILSRIMASDRLGELYIFAQ